MEYGFPAWSWKYNKNIKGHHQSIAGCRSFLINVTMAVAHAAPAAEVKLFGL